MYMNECLCEKNTAAELYNDCISSPHPSLIWGCIYVWGDKVLEDVHSIVTVTHSFLWRVGEGLSLLILYSESFEFFTKIMYNAIVKAIQEIRIFLVLSKFLVLPYGAFGMTFHFQDTRALQIPTFRNKYNFNPFRILIFPHTKQIYLILCLLCYDSTLT